MGPAMPNRYAMSCGDTRTLSGCALGFQDHVVMLRWAHMSLESPVVTRSRLLQLAFQQSPVCLARAPWHSMSSPNSACVRGCGIWQPSSSMRLVTPASGFNVIDLARNRMRMKAHMESASALSGPGHHGEAPIGEARLTTRHITIPPCARRCG